MTFTSLAAAKGGQAQHEISKCGRTLTMKLMTPRKFHLLTMHHLGLDLIAAGNALEGGNSQKASGDLILASGDMRNMYRV
eukprot:JP438380.1.p3 GENE.JP438380.1~~JP438380.1.p3  ORF type:complete len:88 (-),score=18.49 JP438380.1:210-449(-)